MTDRVVLVLGTLDTKGALAMLFPVVELTLNRLSGAGAPGPGATLGRARPDSGIRLPPDRGDFPGLAGGTPVAPPTRPSRAGGPAATTPRSEGEPS